MKSLYVVVNLLFIFICNSVSAQVDTIPLAEVTINSAANPVAFKEISRSIRVIGSNELAAAPVLSLEDVLRFYGGLDVRERGGMGVQSDISIRGGGMEQNLMMLNGVPLNDPQTGHHNTNQAVNLSRLKKIEILEGPGTRWFGPNAFSGGINLITVQPDSSQLNMDLLGGQHGLMFIDLSASFKLGNWNNTTSFGYHTSDGYARNTDFSLWQFNNESTYRLSDGLLRFYLGYLNKGFGANGFYTPKYPDQYEQIQSSLASLSVEKGTRFPVKASLSWRRLYDRFELFREDDLWYKKQGEVYVNGTDTAGFPTSSGLYPYKGHNYHRTDVVSANVGMGFSSVVGSTSVGVTAVYEAIISNVLGDLSSDTLYSDCSDAWYNHHKERHNFTLYLNHSYINGRFSVAGGVSIYTNSDYGIYASPGVDMGYFVRNWFKVYTSVNRAVRVPTFTDLYYQGPDQVSNPNLKPETATTYELGTKMFFSRLTVSTAVFRRFGNDLIDWIKENPEEKWHSMNLTSMITNGMSGSVQYIAKPTFSKPIIAAGVSYTFLDSDKTSEAYLSLYALDYLKHNLVVSVSHRLGIRHLSASWAINVQQRNGSYIDYPTGNMVEYDLVNRVNLKVNYHTRRVDFYISCRNLLNNKSVDYANIPPAGLWLMAGLKSTLNLSLKKR